MIGTQYLAAVEKWTLLLAACAIGVALLALDRRLGFGVSVGAGLAVFNAWLQKRVGRRAFKSFQKPGATILLLNAKMALLVALVYVVIRVLHVHPVGVLLGISIFPVAILIVAVRSHLSPMNGETNGESHGS